MFLFHSLIKIVLNYIFLPENNGESVSVNEELRGKKYTNNISNKPERKS